MARNESEFSIFSRTQKSVSLTPAGKTFVSRLRNIHQEYQEAVEEGENNSDKYKETKMIHLYQSRICLFCNKNDKLTKKPLIHINGLKSQTLMVGGDSQFILKEAQKPVLQSVFLQFQ